MAFDVSRLVRSHIRIQDYEYFRATALRPHTHICAWLDDAHSYARVVVLVLLSTIRLPTLRYIQENRPRPHTGRFTVIPIGKIHFRHEVGG